MALPPDRLPPGRLLAAEAALAEATDAVQQDLRTALQSGEIRATGFRADGAPVPLPPGYWRGPVRWCVAGGATIEADAFERAARGDLVPMEGGFVEPALARGEVARWCGALPPEPAAVYSPEALRAWYRLRVASWPTAAPPPTEREDAVAAAAMFGRAVPRDTLRAARRSLAPTSWRRPGPRRRS